MVLRSRAPDQKPCFLPRLCKDPKRKTWPAGGGSRPAAGGSGALDLDQLAADLGSGTDRARAMASGWRIWNREPCPAAGGSGKKSWSVSG